MKDRKAVRRDEIHNVKPGSIFKRYCLEIASNMKNCQTSSPANKASIMTEKVPASSPAERYEIAERKGLRLAIFCRTAIAAGVLAYLLSVIATTDYILRIWSLVALSIIVITGVLHLSVIGTRFDRWWLKFAIYALDVMIVCALFVIIPVSRSDDVPQIIAFRSYGIYYLFPFVVLSGLSLSWRLVLWTGLVAVVCWWLAFLSVVAGMENTFSWSDIPANATLQDYQNTFLSIDFIGTGNRVEETGFLFAAALILALVVYRARAVFFAQIAAEAREREERHARQEVTQTLGRFVPKTVADQIIADKGAMTPKETEGTILILDIEDFTGFAKDKSPTIVIETLNSFLADCTNIISEHSGVVITFTGDGLLASFNTPLTIESPAQAAMNAAQDLLKTMEASEFKIRIGLASGTIASGSIGSNDRMAFTVYGTTVNRAARLEALCKTLQRSLVMDDKTRERLAADFEAEDLGPQTLRGMTEPENVFGLRSA